MHEGSIAEELVSQAVAQATSSGISRITEIQVSLGEASDVTEEALSLWFDLAKAGTMAERAVLAFEPAEGSEIHMVTLRGEG